MEQIINENTQYLNRLIGSALEIFPYYGPYKEKQRHWRCWKSNLRSFFNPDDQKNYGFDQNDDHRFLCEISSILNLRVITIDVDSLECTIFGPLKPFEYMNRKIRYKQSKKKNKGGRKCKNQIFCGNVRNVSLRRFNLLQDSEIPWIFLKKSDIDCHGNESNEFLLLPIRIHKMAGTAEQVNFTCDWTIGMAGGAFGKDALFFNQLYFIRAKTLEMYSISNDTNSISEYESDWRVHPHDQLNTRLLNTILNHLVQGTNFERRTGFKLRAKCEPNRKRKRYESQNDVRGQPIPNRKRKRTEFVDEVDSTGQTSSSEDLEEDPDLAVWQGKISEVSEEVADKDWVIDLEEDPDVTLWRDKIRKMRERLIMPYSALNLS